MTSLYSERSSCRIGGGHLLPILDLGELAMTGTFRAAEDPPVPTAPIALTWSPNSGLVQLKHSYDTSVMFGDNYGYRSGLNAGMVRHLTNVVGRLEAAAKLAPGNIVVDIGSNDATTLKAYQTPGIRRIGIDPTGTKFASFYPPEIELVPDFFSESVFRSVAPVGRAQIVTSISMFYDLENPIDFARQVESILAEDGIWLLEQSYLPAMLRTTSYDTICHEHLEYYRLGTIREIIEAAGLKLVDVAFNDVNGGSFTVMATRSASDAFETNSVLIDWVIDQEKRAGLETIEPYLAFARRVEQHRNDLRDLIGRITSAGKSVIGYGASTKGNVLLQYCGFDANIIPAIAEVNSDKFGRRTPGTGIPMISEAEAHSMQPDYFLVLPWHFKAGILDREKDYRERGGKFIFPLPHIEVV